MVVTSLPSSTEVSEWFDRTFPEAVSLLDRIVTCSSCTRDRDGVNAVQDIAAEFLRSVGLEVSFRTTGDSARTLWAEVPGFKSSKKILLSGHVDTVHPRDDWSSSLVEEGDKLIGPGVADMKGGVVEFLWVLRFLHDHGLLARLPVRVLLTPDEEIASPSSQPFLREAASDSELALVFEPGRLNGAIVTQRRGAAGVEVKVVGKASHAGNAFHEGKSAIHQLAHTVGKLFALNGTIPGANVNVGVVQGGTTANTVAAVAEALVDLRYTTLEQRDQLVEALKIIENDHIVPGIQMSFSEGSFFPPMPELPETLVLYGEYAVILKEFG
ncbi:MAG: M20/M25/M40 family metallo-hydrolase, partial [Bdellovibrionales bacterium]|nr:M20/M25/M40 family metallo-hydrolase [Bdellovibrionales bacterium]